MGLPFLKVQLKEGEKEEKVSRKRWIVGFAAVFVLAILFIGAFLIFYRGSAAEAAYLPALKVQGDVQNAAELKAEGKTYVLTFSNGEGEEKDAGKTMKTYSFTFEGEKHSGILLSDVIEQTGLAAEKSHIYFAGWDGMMSAIDAVNMEKNYIVFGSNGWEVMNEGYPASSNVKEMECIVAVADRPADVEDSLTVKDDGGYERTLSAGTLFLMDSAASRKYHGQSEKSGKSVVVFTTDRFVEIGGQRLKMEGNKIVSIDEESGAADGVSDGADGENGKRVSDSGADNNAGQMSDGANQTDGSDEKE